MIKVSEVIEACAQAAESTAIRQGMSIDEAKEFGEAIRSLAAKYEDCIVAEGKPSAVYKGRDYEYRVPLVDLPRGDVEYMTRLYRAKEPTK